MESDISTPGLAGWDDIKSIEQQLVGVMDTLVGSDVDHVMARRALARTIALMRAEKSWEFEAVINHQFARQLRSFHFIDSGLVA
nr:hypothetical protein [Candidatus Sigynarchaeota archaeon]